MFHYCWHSSSGVFQSCHRPPVPLSPTPLASAIAFFSVSLVSSDCLWAERNCSECRCSATETTSTAMPKTPTNALGPPTTDRPTPLIARQDSTFGHIFSRKRAIEDDIDVTSVGYNNTVIPCFNSSEHSSTGLQRKFSACYVPVWTFSALRII